MQRSGVIFRDLGQWVKPVVFTFGHDRQSFKELAVINIAITGFTHYQIAVIVETSESTISRELKRNTGRRGYRPKQAQNKASRRKQNAAKAIKMPDKVIALVNEQIRFDLSPEKVSGYLKEQHGIHLSHGIYQHIRADRRTGVDLYTHLRQAHKKRSKKYGAKNKRGQICNRVSIDQRPDIVDEKSRIGDWGERKRGGVQ